MQSPARLIVISKDDLDAMDEPAAGMMNVHCNGVMDNRISCMAREEQ
jgi:hypothetical protein